MKVSELEKLVIELAQTMKDHAVADKIFQDKMNRVLFGSEEEQEIGVVEMIKTMYSFFTTSKNVRSIVIGMAILGGAVITIKGWWFSIISFLAK